MRAGEAVELELARPPAPPASRVSLPADPETELLRLTTLLLEFQLAARQQDLAAVARMLSPDLDAEEREKQLARVRESLWLPLYRRYQPRIDEALEELDPEDLLKGEVHLKVAIDTPAGDVEHDEFRARREPGPGWADRWVFTKLKLERPERGEYLVPPADEAEEMLATVEGLVVALEAGDAQGALELASPALTAKQRRHLKEEIHDRFLKRYLPRTDPVGGRPVRSQQSYDGRSSVRYLFVVSQDEAPGSVFRYYDHGEIAIPINVHYLKPRGLGYEEKMEKCALVFRWSSQPEGGEAGEGGPGPGCWELVDTVRRDKGFWRGVGRVFAAIGKGTVQVGGGILHDLPYLVPTHVRIQVSH